MYIRLPASPVHHNFVRKYTFGDRIEIKNEEKLLGGNQRCLIVRCEDRKNKLDLFKQVVEYILSAPQLQRHKVVTDSKFTELEYGFTFMSFNSLEDLVIKRISMYGQGDNDNNNEILIVTSYIPATYGLIQRIVHAQTDTNIYILAIDGQGVSRDTDIYKMAQEFVISSPCSYIRHGETENNNYSIFLTEQEYEESGVKAVVEKNKREKDDNKV